MTVSIRRVHKVCLLNSSFCIIIIVVQASTEMKVTVSYLWDRLTASCRVQDMLPGLFLLSEKISQCENLFNCIILFHLV